MSRALGAACRRGGALALVGLAGLWGSGLLLCLLAFLLIGALGLLALCGICGLFGLAALALLPRENRVPLRHTWCLLARLARLAAGGVIGTALAGTSTRK